MSSYHRFVDRTPPSGEGAVSSAWLRLQFVWESMVIEAHRRSFSDYVSTIVPRLTSECTRLQGLVAEEWEWPDEGLGAVVRQWLERLAADPGDSVPQLVRSDDRSLHLLDGRHRREVGSGLVGAILEAEFGPARSTTAAELALYEDGPPVVLLVDDLQDVYVVAGNQRYRVTGIPVPLFASPGDLAQFKVADEVLDAEGSLPWQRRGSAPTDRP
jgi:hypothetical protein